MRRRAGVIAATPSAAMAVAFAGLTTVGVGAAHAARVPASGAIACDWDRGRATFTPAFVYGGTSPTVVRFHGHVHCRSGSNGNDPAPFGITGANVRGSLRVPMNACGGDHQDGGPGTVTFRWQARPRVVPTQFSTDSSFWQFDYEGLGFSGSVFGMPAPAFTGGGVASGSFAGHAGVVVAGRSAATGNECRPRADDVAGSGGVKKFAIDPGGTIFFLP